MSKDVIRILHFSSTLRDPYCGIGRYQEQYLAGMAGDKRVVNKFFNISPYQTRAMSPEEMDKAMEELKTELKEYDILHIQHEFGLYWDDQFAKIVAVGKDTGKKIIVTVHLSPANVPELKPVKLGGLGPHSWMHYAKELRHHNRMLQYHIEPMKRADLLLVHTTLVAKSLEGFGIEALRIRKLPHPVYDMPVPPKSDEIAKKLDKQPGDIIFCVTGFLHRYKNITDAVKALKFLPDNYKLALIGGVKSDSDEVTYENKITDLVDAMGLHKRVYITGYIEDDSRLNALVRECDVCIYPYDGVYYGNASSGALGLAFVNDMPVIAYPTPSFIEGAAEVEGSVVFCETYAYYEIARELQRIDFARQRKLAKEYAIKMAWPKLAKELIAIYETVITA
ncbi:MAG TPA: glycosyltransferase [Candidatus Acidoferrum sp.]|nr:glycosyltransferase [Candidatus Acidoferrum sp.]